MAVADSIESIKMNKFCYLSGRVFADEFSTIFGCESVHFFAVLENLGRVSPALFVAVMCTIRKTRKHLY